MQGPPLKSRSCTWDGHCERGLQARKHSSEHVSPSVCVFWCGRGVQALTNRSERVCVCFLVRQGGMIAGASSEVAFLHIGRTLQKRPAGTQKVQ